MPRSFAVSATQFHNEQYKHRKGVLHDHGTIYGYIKFVLAMVPVVSSRGKRLPTCSFPVCQHQSSSFLWDAATHPCEDSSLVLARSIFASDT